jgi:hypothetical protein
MSTTILAAVGVAAFVMYLLRRQSRLTSEESEF